MTLDELLKIEVNGYYPVLVQRRYLSIKTNELVTEVKIFLPREELLLSQYENAAVGEEKEVTEKVRKGYESWLKKEGHL